MSEKISVDTEIPALAEADIAGLRERYAQEREKRVRRDGRHQFVEPTLESGDQHAEWILDPFAEVEDREPLLDEVDCLIIGAGLGGLMAGAMLRDLGFERIRILDKGGDFGGTWYWNQYPGARCDIESYIYLPLLEETGYMPTEKYVAGPEILEHARRIARHYGLDRDVHFHTFVHRMEWDETSSRWVVYSDRGDRIRARYLFPIPGPLQRPHLPAIPGIETYTGRAFFTSRWDYEYTKGDSTGGLTGLLDKRVAVIGTGATGIQVIPVLAEYCEHLYVVQRTPCSLGERENPPTDLEWAEGLEAGWQARRMRNFSNIVSGMPEAEDLVSDAFSTLLSRLSAFVPGDGDDPVVALEKIDLATQELIRRRIDEVIDDPAVAAALKPYFRQFCKRPTFSNEYFQTFNRPNVTLVDTDGRGLSRITETGIVNGEDEYEVDCIIFASGFEADADFTIHSGYQVIGRDGASLSEKWKDGARTFQAIHVHDFPNLFLIGSGSHGGFYFNYVNRLFEDVKQLRYILQHMLAVNASSVEATREAEDSYVEQIRTLANLNLEFFRACTPGQYNNYGNPDETLLLNTGWGAGAPAWERYLEDWRTEGRYEGLTFD